FFNNADVKTCTKLCLLPPSPSDRSRRRCRKLSRPPLRNSRRARQTRKSRSRKSRAQANLPRASGRKRALTNRRKCRPEAKLKKERHGRVFWSDCNKRLKSASK